jgi:hypothetical protein
MYFGTKRNYLNKWPIMVNVRHCKIKSFIVTGCKKRGVFLDVEIFLSRDQNYVLCNKNENMDYLCRIFPLKNKKLGHSTKVVFHVNEPFQT